MGLPEITDCLSAQYSGCSAPVLLGAICPPDDGDWKNTHRRLSRWRDKGVWGPLLEALVTAPDVEWLLMDAMQVRVHPHAAGARGGDRSMG